MKIPCWPVVDGVCSCPEAGACRSPGKHPLTPNGLKDARADWGDEHAGANWALITGGESDTIVIDLDVKPGKDGVANFRVIAAEHGGIPRTRTIRTGSGGLHLYFRHPGWHVNNSAGRLARGVDVRGDGGYVMIPPSNHISGSQYVVVLDVPAVDLPDWLADAIAALAKTDDARRFPPATAEVMDAAWAALEKHGPAVEGDGGDSHTFVAAAILVHDFALTQDEALPLFEEWNETCQPPWPVGALRSKLRGGIAYGKRPYGCLRPVDTFKTAEQAIEAWQQTGSADPTALIQTIRALPFQDPATVAAIARRIHGLTGITARDQALPKVKLRTPGASDAPPAEEPTEDSVAASFASEFKDRLRFCKVWGSWLEWRGTRWERERTDLALHVCRELARTANVDVDSKVAKASFASGVEKLARAARELATVPEQWDCNTWLLNTPAGVVNLETGAVREHNPADYLTRITQVAPVPGPMPVFKKFLREICCDDRELGAYLQRALGACLSGARSDHFLLFCIGEGANGKNTLGDLVEKILGSYAKTVPVETLMSTKSERHPTELANLMGLRLAISSEVPEGSHWNEARIKSLTGDATVSARFMRADFFEFDRTHKHLVYGNNRPQLRTVDEAIRRRLHIIPFKATFSDALGNKDANLPAKLWTEAPAILAWLIEGHAQWLADGYLKRCEAVRRETDDYFEAQSTPDMWLAERCVREPEARTGASQLYQDFSMWKAQRGESPMSQTRWGEWMGVRFVRRVANGSIRYEGLRLVGG